ncbi:helix-turn-helix transcriptional regulator, partial [Streptomyces lavendulae]|uniref:helix-turn-helix transcriptional regulator n=1 Tax=Streptomyces lavendulae TaxID=1914 RepID=UPI0037FC6CA7
MIATSARLLRLVSLLSSRPTWSNADLARHLDVTDRTVRRDIDRLRELGYGVESVPGPGGGYRFGAGNRMPPLSLDDDEVFAVAMALREAAQGAALGADPAALSALLKLRQILPVRMARRLESLDATVEHTPRCESPRASADVLLLLASVCRASERATLTYRDTHGITTVRCVDPHRLVHTGVHWYFVARDVERSAWRTFRADRVVDVESTGEVVDLSDAPDAAQLVSDTITRTGYPFFARVRLPLSYDDARRLVAPIVATHESEGP